MSVSVHCFNLKFEYRESYVRLLNPTDDSCIIIILSFSSAKQFKGRRIVGSGEADRPFEVEKEAAIAGVQHLHGDRCCSVSEIVIELSPR